MEPLKPIDDWTDDECACCNNTEENESRKDTRKTRFFKFLRSNLLVSLMLVGVLLGVIFGIGLNSMDERLSKIQLVYLRFPGDLFLQMMKMLLIPIVVSSLLCSMAEIDIRSLGRIGLMALGYYFVTLVLASILGITLAVTIRPGERTSDNRVGEHRVFTQSQSPGLAFMDLLRNMIPDNLIEVCFSTKKSYVVESVVFMEYTVSNAISNIGNLTESIVNDMINKSSETNRSEPSLAVEKLRGSNMIGLVVSSIVFGCVTSAAGAEAKPFLDFFQALRTVAFRVVGIFVWFSPVGIAFLIAAKLAEMENPAKTFQDLGIFSITVITGLVIHGFIVLSLIYFIATRKNPYRLVVGMLPAMVFAFGSESSSATLPLTIKCLEERNGVDARVTKLIASLGSTVNMDGSCMYYSLITIFIAQLNNTPLSVGEYVTISILAISISIGGAGIPSAGIIYMLMIVTSMGLPTHDISTILAVDWFLARCRTVINILGDGYGAGIIGHLSRRELKKMSINLPTKHNDEWNREVDSIVL